MLQPKVAVVQRRQHLSFLRDVAGAQARGPDEAVERSDKRTLYATFNPGVGVDVIGRKNSIDRQDRQDQADECELLTITGRAKQLLGLLMDGGDDLEEQRPIVEALFDQDRG